MGGAFVCAALGITPTVRHADYIGSWLEIIREDNRAIVRAASAASKAADYLLAFRDRKSVVEGKSVTVRVDLGGRRIIKKNKRQSIDKESIVTNRNTRKQN